MESTGPIWTALNFRHNSDHWNAAHKGSLRSALSGRQWPQKRCADSGFGTHDKCLLCLDATKRKQPNAVPTQATHSTSHTSSTTGQDHVDVDTGIAGTGDCKSKDTATRRRPSIVGSTKVNDERRAGYPLNKEPCNVPEAVTELEHEPLTGNVGDTNVDCPDAEVTTCHGCEVESDDDLLGDLTARRTKRCKIRAGTDVCDDGCDDSCGARGAACLPSFFFAPTLDWP